MTDITIEFENDKHLQDFIKNLKLEKLRKFFEGEKVDFFLTWEEPLG